MSFYLETRDTGKICCVKCHVVGSYYYIIESKYSFLFKDQLIMYSGKTSDQAGHESMGDSIK